MAEKRKPKLTQVTDKKQSENFKKVARELEADGDLNLTEAKEKFENALDAIHQKTKKERTNSSADE
jgi:CelD/BcsL family acetyltransferase involved in cellulose biosynthesis